MQGTGLQLDRFDRLELDQGAVIGLSVFSIWLSLFTSRTRLGGAERIKYFGSTFRSYCSVAVLDNEFSLELKGRMAGQIQRAATGQANARNTLLPSRPSLCHPSTCIVSRPRESRNGATLYLKDGFYSRKDLKPTPPANP